MSRLTDYGQGKYIKEYIHICIYAFCFASIHNLKERTKLNIASCSYNLGLLTKFVCYGHSSAFYSSPFPGLLDILFDQASRVAASNSEKYCSGYTWVKMKILKFFSVAISSNFLFCSIKFQKNPNFLGDLEYLRIFLSYLVCFWLDQSTGIKTLCFVDWGWEHLSIFELLVLFYLISCILRVECVVGWGCVGRREPGGVCQFTINNRSSLSLRASHQPKHGVSTIVPRSKQRFIKYVKAKKDQSVLNMVSL